MARFYRLLRQPIDPLRAADARGRVVARAPREPVPRPAGAGEALIVALRDLYAYSYGVEPDSVRQAAALRAEAMDVSDRWVKAGCDPADPQLAHERSLLVRSYAALLAAVHR